MKKQMIRTALAAAALAGFSAPAHAQLAVIDVKSIAQALQTARNTLQQLQEAQKLYTALNSISNVRSVSNLLDLPILQKALPEGVQSSVKLLSSDLRELGAIGQRAESIMSGQNLTLASLDSRLGDAQGVLTSAATIGARTQAYSEHMLDAAQASSDGLQQLSQGLAGATTMRESTDIGARATIENAGINNRILQLQAADQAARAQAALKASADFADAQRRTQANLQSGALWPTWNGK